MTTVEIRERLAVIQIASDIWSGQTTLEGSDIRIGAGGELPSQELARLGFKWLVDKKSLRPLKNAYNRLRSVCENYGLPFLGGYAVPHEKIDQVSKELDEIVLLGLTRKADYLADYDKICEEWAARNSEYSHILRAAKVPREIVAKKIDFGYRIYSVQPVNQSEASKIDRIANNLGNELMDELVEEAIGFFTRAVKDKETIQSSTRKTFTRIRGKLKSLSFLDPKFESVVSMLDETLHGYIAAPKEIVGDQYFRILAATHIMASRDMVNKLASGAITLQSVMENLKRGLGIHGVSVAAQAQASSPTLIVPASATVQPALDLELSVVSSTFF